MSEQKPRGKAEPDKRAADRPDQKPRAHADADTEKGAINPSGHLKAAEQKVGYDKFILNDVYPDAAAIFGWSIKPLSALLSSALVVLDTNVLLVPYGIGAESFGDIRAMYQKLRSEGRLVVPGQVAREFARLRGRKLAEVFQQVTDRRSKVLERSAKHPLLESVPEYAEALAKDEQTSELAKDQAKLLGQVLDRIMSWRWDDPVSRAYGELFDSAVVVDSPVDRRIAEADLDRRTIHSLPPAYKDRSKDDGGIGDLLIWYTICEAGATRNNDVIFVSGEEKSDWWQKGAGRTLYPRYELVDEFRRRTSGKSFHLVSLAQLLELYDVQASTVGEVRAGEYVTAAGDNASIAVNPLVAALPRVEKAVATLAAQGFSLQPIANKLSLSVDDAAMYLFDAQRTLDQLEAERAATASTITFLPTERWDITRGCIEFPVEIRGNSVTCRISEEALQDHFGAKGVPTLLPTFNAFRPAIEAVARRKIVFKQLDDGAVSITTADFRSTLAG